MNKHPFLLLIGLLWLETGFSQEPSIYKKIDARISQLTNQELHVMRTAREFPDNYDVRYYGIELEILTASKSIAGKVTIHASILKDATNALVLNLHNNMTVNSVGGNAISSSHQDHLLTLQLDRVYHTGEEIVVTITYAGQPKKGTSYEPFHFEKANNTWYISSDNEPYEARLWLPCNDHPGDKADSTDMMITVPGDLYVVSNGLLKEVVDHPDGTKTFHWQEQYPIATYLMSLAISNYVFFDDRYVTATGDSMSLQFYAYPANLTKAKKEFAITADAIRYFVPIFGEYPFLKEKYGMVEYSGHWGGMENQTITSIGSTAIRGDGSAEFLIAHELAHQWWGDWVTPTHFDHIWLNEGFATYAEVLYAGAKYGQDFADYYMNLIMESALPSQGPIFRYGSDEIITWIVYGKGAAVLHMLRQLIGDMAFFDALRAYGQTHAFGNASTEDFQSFCEASSGTDLDWFFHQWIYEPGHPTYKYAWTSVKKNEMEYELIGYIDQIQSEGPVFRMPLDIFITTSDGATIKETMLVDDASETFRFTVQGQPTQLILDKDNRVLKEVVLATPEPKIIFRGHTFDDSRGNGNGYWDRGETIDVVLWLGALSM